MAVAYCTVCGGIIWGVTQSSDARPCTCSSNPNKPIPAPRWEEMTIEDLYGHIQTLERRVTQLEQERKEMDIVDHLRRKSVL